MRSTIVFAARSQGGAYSVVVQRCADGTLQGSTLTRGHCTGRAVGHNERTILRWLACMLPDLGVRAVVIENHLVG